MTLSSSRCILPEAHDIFPTKLTPSLHTRSLSFLRNNTTTFISATDLFLSCPGAEQVSLFFPFCSSVPDSVALLKYTCPKHETKQWFRQQLVTGEMVMVTVHTIYIWHPLCLLSTSCFRQPEQVSLHDLSDNVMYMKATSSPYDIIPAHIIKDISDTTGSSLKSIMNSCLASNPIPPSF